MLQLWLICNIVAWSIHFPIGDLTLGMNVVVLLIIGPIWLWRRKKITLHATRTAALFAGILVISFYFAITGPCTDKLLKAAVTAPIMLFLVLLGWEIGRTATDQQWLNLHKTCSLILLLTFGGFFFEMAFPSLFPFEIIYRQEGKFSGIFQEPSHVAYSLFPVIAILLVSQEKKIRKRGLYGLAGLLLLSRSSTMIALIFSWMLYRLFVQRRVREGFLLIAALLLVIGAAAVVNYETLLGPTAERISGILDSSDTTNLSSLVYVQGWQDMFVNLERTHGLGLGFNMMGCTPLPDVTVRQLLSLGGLGDINADDGSFQFAKIVSEAGIFGIAFYVCVIIWWIRIEKRIRLSPPETTAVASLQAALLFCFISCSFIRGGGYFNAGILIWLIAISGASSWQSHHSHLIQNGSKLVAAGRSLK